MKRVGRKVKRIICCLLIGLLLSEKIAAAVYAEESTQSAMEAEAGNEVGIGYETVSGNDAEIENEDEVRNEAGEEIPAEPYAVENRADSGEFLIDNLIYRIDIDSENTVTCVGYVPDLSGAVVIPEEVKNGDDSYTVCGIGDKAFSKLDKMTSVQLPDTITTIGKSAFEHCYALETINMPLSVTSIGESAFEMCIGLKCDISIPEGVTEIKPKTFISCPITAITLPDGLKTIGKEAFGACVHLESVSIPETVTDIGEDAFMSCYKLKSINIPKGITVIKKGTFGQCGFESFDIPEHITTMEFSVFDGCSNLERVYIPESVTSMAGGAFCNCPKLKSIEIPKTIPEVGQLTFLNCSNLTELKMWDTTKIGLAPVFEGCQKFTTLKIVITSDKPRPLTINKPDDSFKGCPAERSIVFLNEDGTELTGEALKAAQDAYRAVNDGNTEDNLWYGWKIGDAPEVPSVTLYQITATANGGGIISPDGTVNVSEGADQTFTITPQEGYEIQEVLVDGKSQGVIDKDKFTFTNVKENHTISVSFLKKEETGGTEKPGENEGGTGETEKPGENAGETEGTDRPGESESNNGGSGNRGNVGSEPKTGDVSSVEIYATAAMIAGLLYLLLSFADMKGLTETKKKEIISSIIGWADDGRKYRRYVAFAAIFFVLVYYHSIGKSTMAEAKCVF